MIQEMLLLHNYLMSQSDVCDDLIELLVCLWIVGRVLKLENVLEALSILGNNLLTRWLSM